MEENEIYLAKILVCGFTGALRSFISNGILGEPLLDETKEILTVKTWKDDRNGMIVLYVYLPLLTLIIIVVNIRGWGGAIPLSVCGRGGRYSRLQSFSKLRNGR